MNPASTTGIVELLAPLTGRFDRAGRRLYVVGGLVRDLILGRDLDITDIDCTTDAVPDEVIEILAPWADALWTQGARFGTIGATHDGRTYEITTHRSEVYVEDSRKPRVSYSTRIEDDLARRDFTVNAMAVDLGSGVLIDPFGGRRDLDRSVLRTPLDPDVSFSEDPLRMLRAARFHAGYDLAPVAALLASIERLRDRLAIVAIERIREELDKLLAVPRPEAGLLLLVDTGLAGVFLGGRAASAPAELRAELVAVSRAVPVGHRRLALLAHLVAPDDPPGLVARLRASNETKAQVTRLVGAIDELGDLAATWDDESVRRFVAAPSSRARGGTGRRVRHGPRSLGRPAATGPCRRAGGVLDRGPGRRRGPERPGSAPHRPRPAATARSRRGTRDRSGALGPRPASSPYGTDRSRRGRIVREGVVRERSAGEVLGPLSGRPRSAWMVVGTPTEVRGMRSNRVLGLIVAFVMVAGCGDDDDTTSPEVTTSTSTAPEATTSTAPEATTSTAPEATTSTTVPAGLGQPAVWPAADVVFATPEEAASDFVRQVLDVPPELGEFQAGDSRSGEIQVFSRGEAGSGIEIERGLLFMRQLGPDDGWFVIAAVSPYMEVASPVSGSDVSAAPLPVDGRGRGFEAAVIVSVFVAGDAARELDRVLAQGGSVEEPEPFSVELDLSAASPGETVVLLVRGGTGLETDPGDFTAIPLIVG